MSSLTSESVQFDDSTGQYSDRSLVVSDSARSAVNALNEELEEACKAFGFLFAIVQRIEEPVIKKIYEDLAERNPEAAESVSKLSVSPGMTKYCNLA